MTIKNDLLPVRLKPMLISVRLFSAQFSLSWLYVLGLDVVRLEATGNPGDCVSDSGFYST